MYTHKSIFITFTLKLRPSPEYFAAICRAFSAAERAAGAEKGVGLGKIAQVENHTVRNG